MLQTTTSHNEQEYPPYRPMIPPLTPPSDEPGVSYSQPTIYVQTSAKWHYKIIDYALHETADLAAADLDELGKEGWELAGTLPLSGKVRFFFKRPR